jgi:hypothetical protein
MPSNLLLLPLLGGYCFIHFFYYLRFRSQRLDGYRLLIESACAAGFLVTMSRLIVLGLKLTPFGDWLKQYWDAFCPFPYSATAGGSVLIGLTLPFVLNYFWNEKSAKNKVLENHGNALFKHSMTRRVRARLYP